MDAHELSWTEMYGEPVEEWGPYSPPEGSLPDGSDTLRYTVERTTAGFIIERWCNEIPSLEGETHSFSGRIAYSSSGEKLGAELSINGCIS